LKDFLIAPSILSADFAKLGKDVSDVLDAGGDIVHFDVMDNHYVPNLTIGPLVCKALRNHGIKADIDVHLMVSPVDRIIGDFIEAGASWISVHPDATIHLDRSIQLIKSGGCKAGVVLNPAATLDSLEFIIEQLDFILLMSVNPGFGGQKFIPYTLTKLNMVRDLIKKRNLDIRVAVDGGVYPKNIKEIAEAGADTFIAGNAIFSSGDYKKTIDEMRSELSKAAL